MTKLKLIVTYLDVMTPTTTKRTALDILLATTKPKSKEEMKDFLIRKHGADYASRSNASSDITALDDRDLAALRLAQEAK
jgi:hypothetical protein